MSTKGKAIHISKLDAAVRQLEVAIKMFFSYGDPVAIHTLAAAAHGVIADLGEKQNLKGILRDMSIVRAERRDEVKVMLRKPQNFFKHSDRDGQEKEIIEFIPSLTEFFLYDTCMLYVQIANENRTILQLYNVWFFLNHPGLLVDVQKEAKMIEIARSLQLNVQDRGAFLSILPDMIKAQGGI